MNGDNLETDECIRYYPLPVCGNGVCVNRSNFTSEQLENKFPRSYCECSPGWYQTFEFSSYTPDEVELRQLPCVVHETFSRLSHSLVLLVALSSLLYCLAYVAKEGRETKKGKPENGYWLSVYEFKAVPGLVGLTLLAAAQSYRLLDLPKRGIIIDYNYTTLVLAFWLLVRLN